MKIAATLAFVAASALVLPHANAVGFADLANITDAEDAYHGGGEVPLPLSSIRTDTYADEAAPVLSLANTAKQSVPAPVPAPVPAMASAGGKQSKLTSLASEEDTEIANTLEAIVESTPTLVSIPPTANHEDDGDDAVGTAVSTAPAPVPSPTVVATEDVDVDVDGDDDDDDGDDGEASVTDAPTPAPPTHKPTPTPVTPKPTPMAIASNDQNEDDDGDEGDNTTSTLTPKPTVRPTPAPVTPKPSPTTVAPVFTSDDDNDDDGDEDDHARQPAPTPTYKPAVVPAPVPAPAPAVLTGNAAGKQSSFGGQPWKQTDNQRPTGPDTEPDVNNGGVNLYPYTADIRNYIVEQHNFARATMVPQTAANMRKLEWHEALAIEASELVNTCVFEHDTENYAYGQNLMYGNDVVDKTTVENWMKAWVENEISPSDRAGNGYLDLDHASAVLWAKSYYVGCASKLCPNGYLTACNYHTPGNWQGEQAFVPGPACSQCPSQASYCDAQYGKLCTGNPSGKPAPTPTPAPAMPAPKPTPAKTAPAPKPTPAKTGPASKPVPAPAPKPTPAKTNQVQRPAQKPATQPSKSTHKLCH